MLKQKLLLYSLGLGCFPESDSQNESYLNFKNIFFFAVKARTGGGRGFVHNWPFLILGPLSNAALTPCNSSCIIAMCLTGAPL